MKRTRAIVVAVAVAGLVGIVAIAVALAVLRSPGRAPSGQPALVDLRSAGLTAFTEAFNGAADRTRVVVMLSPT